MKKLFSILLGLVCVAGLVFAVSGCNKEDAEISNTITIRGATLEIDHAIYSPHGENATGLHVQTKGGDKGLFGWGEFDSAWIGKTTNLKGEFFMSFNPNDGGPSIDPEIKSGTFKVSKVEKGLHVIVDAVETNGYAFKMNFLAEDEDSFNARQ